ncbi:MAG: hypothetical protein IJ667_04785 [Synergistaceae bacterium]|nr:hypothetical protein [Synergistaceae bacterium]
MEELNEREERFDFDGFWKDLIARFWREMLLSVMPDLYYAADLSVEPEFLDKELRDIMQSFDAQQDEHNPPRFVDALMKIALKSGGDEWVLLHIEIQGPGGEDLPSRMHRYYCLLFAHHGRHPAALAILTEPRPKENKNFYEFSHFGTSIKYSYNCLDIEALDEDALRASDNPFDLAIYASRKAKRCRKDELQKFIYLRELWTLLNAKGWERKDRRALLLFLERIINLKSEALRVKYINEYRELEEKRMPYESWIEKAFKDEGIEIGRAEGISIGEARGRSEGINIGRSEGINIGRAEGISIGEARGRSEGISIGEARGRSEGISIGEARGRSEAYSNAAQRMLEIGLAISDIMQCTGLSPEDIDALAAKIKN